MKVVLTLLLLLSWRPALALTIATGTPEGTYYQIAQDIKKIADKEGIPFDIIQTNGSLDNINLLGLEKVDLAILQLDVLKVTSDRMQTKADFNIFEVMKVILNLYYEEIHVLTKSDGIRSISQLEGKRVAVGPEGSGSALTAAVLLTAYDLNVERSFDTPNDALRKLEGGELDALIFVGGAPVPAFENLDAGFRFVRLPPNPLLEQIYQRKKISKGVYAWAGEVETFAVPSVYLYGFSISASGSRTGCMPSSQACSPSWERTYSTDFATASRAGAMSRSMRVPSYLTTRPLTTTVCTSAVPA
jgi:hypothetical protein